MDTIKSAVMFNRQWMEENKHAISERVRLQNDEHIQVITKLIEKEEEAEIQDIFIESSLERMVPLTPLEWTVDDVGDWLILHRR